MVLFGAAHRDSEGSIIAQEGSLCAPLRMRPESRPMLRYALNRLLMMGPTLLGVATMVFVVLEVVPGDPVDVMLGESASPVDRAALRRDLGLDRPLVERYLGFVGGTLRGDLGESIRSGRPVIDAVAERLPATFALAFASLILALTLAIPAGVVAAAKSGSRLDRWLSTLSVLGAAIPNFWLGPMLIIVFAIGIGALPVSGASSPAHLVLPAITLGASMSGFLMRLVRAAMLETLREDFVRTARAKGATEIRIVWRHALPAALIPILSVAGLQLGGLLAGSLITETIFAWPGIGSLTIEAIHARDFPLLEGCVLVIAVAYVAVNLATDLAYAFVDPRIRYDDAR